MKKERRLPPLSIRDVLLSPFKISKINTALLIVDMQYLDAHWDYGYIHQLREKGLSDNLLYYQKRLQLAKPNIQKLQDKFREKGMEVIYTRIQSLTIDGRERSRIHKALGINVLPNSKESEILEELKPIEDEIIFNKTSSSAFNSTNIDYVLRNLGIECLIMTGIMNSVEATARDGYEKGYYVKVVEDACCSEKPEFHEQSVEHINYIFGEVVQVGGVLEALNKL